MTYTYDSAGNLNSYNDGATTAEYVYDELHRKVSDTVNYGPFTLSASYTYYKNGMKMSYTGPDGVTYTYSYDANNQLTSVQIPGKGSITFTNQVWYQPGSVILPGGGRQYTYDPLMRPQTITVQDMVQNVFMDYQYTYDAMGNVTSNNTERGAYAYNYDNLYRLVQAGSPVPPGEAFTYDAVGNRLSASGVAQDYGYSSNNELLGYDGVTFIYDSNGNTIQKTAGSQATYYTYDVQDRLVQVGIGSGLIASYGYDPFGRRLWKDVGGTRNYFFYSDEGLIGEYNAGGVEIKTYGYRPGSNWTTDPLFMKQGGTYYFYQNDHLGTPMQTIESNGTVAWSATYNAFGEAQVDTTSSVTNNLRFPDSIMMPRPEIIITGQDITIRKWGAL